MPQLLHIITKSEDTLARETILQQQRNPENKIEVVDVTIGEPDYKALAQKVFNADSVQVW